MSETDREKKHQQRKWIIFVGRLSNSKLPTFCTTLLPLIVHTSNLHNLWNMNEENLYIFTSYWYFVQLFTLVSCMKTWSHFQISVHNSNRTNDTWMLTSLMNESVTIHITEHCGLSGKVLDLHSGGIRFESWRGIRLTSLRCFVSFLRPIRYVNNKLRGLSPQANYTDRATAASRRS
jgi:hypothetical protein